MIISKHVSDAIQALNQASNRDELLVATTNLANTESLDAVTKLIEVLGYNNPATAVVATRGLIQLGPPVIPLLLDSLDASDYTTRAWLITILADIRDPRSLERCRRCSHNISPSVRRTALRGLATVPLTTAADGQRSPSLSRRPDQGI